jgi:hypothetical protein
MRASVVFLLVMSSLLFSACGDDGVESPEKRFSAQDTFAVDVARASRKELDLYGVNGTIIVEGSPGATAVSVFAVMRVESDTQADADAHLAQLGVQVDSTDQAVLVETTQPTQSGGRNYIVNYTVTLPQGFNVVVNNANGNVTLRRVVGIISIDLGNGAVSLDNDEGSTAINLANGTIGGRVTLPPGGEMSMNLANGNVNIEIPQSTSAQFHAETGIGSVTVVGLYLQGAVIEQDRVTGTLGGGDGTIDLSVANGDIYVEGF